MSNNVVRYSGVTDKFLIPYFRPDFGDTGSGTTESPRVSARAEQRAKNIIDMQLWGSFRTNLRNTYYTCVLNEGDWTVSGNTVTLSSLEAFIAGIFVNNRGNSISWTSIPTGISQDLFVKRVETNREQSFNEDFVSSKEYGDLNIEVIPTADNYSNTNYLKMASVLL